MRQLQLTLIMLILAPVMVLGENTGSSSGVLNFTATDKKFLEIRTPDNLACSIDLMATPQKSVDAKYEILADVRSDEVKDRYFKLIQVSMDDNTQSAGGLRLRVLTPTEAPWEGKDSHIRLNIHINVPYNFKIDSKNSYSDLKLTGPLDEVTVNNEYGTVSVVDVKGTTIIKTSYSEIYLDKIQGDIDIQTSYSSILARDIVIGNNIGVFETSYGSITLENIKGPLEASTSYGLINASDLEALDGSIVLRTSYGKIEAEKISGEIICETSYSPVDLSEINFTHGMNSVETRYSPINIEMFKINDAQLIINNTYNNINLSLPKDISARLTLAVDKGGKIHTLGIPIKPLVMEKTRLEGLVGDGRSQVELNIDGIGEINIETR
jgi:hypothetical protein